MKGDSPCDMVIAESGWYHGVRKAFVPVRDGRKAVLFFSHAPHSRSGKNVRGFPSSHFDSTDKRWESIASQVLPPKEATVGVEGLQRRLLDHSAVP
jgi:hypothetical protein